MVRISETTSLFSTAFVGRRARGAIVDGLIRDKRLIDKLDRFPVFGRGLRPTDSLGWVAIAEYDIPVCVFGLTVYPCNLVVCGSDGSIVIPRDHAFEIMKNACEKALTENNARELLLNGGLLRDVWEKYRVL